jgi:hypothetical protein
MLWLLLEKCRWRDVILTAIVFVLLSHTYLVGFGTGATVAALISPVIVRRHIFAFRKLAVLAAIVGPEPSRGSSSRGFIGTRAHLAGMVPAPLAG